MDTIMRVCGRIECSPLGRAGLRPAPTNLWMDYFFNKALQATPENVAKMRVLFRAACLGSAVLTVWGA